MEYIPIKTRVMNPPKDDLFLLIKESKLGLQEKDVLLVTSKVVSIDEARCIPTAEADKSELIKAVSNQIIGDVNRQFPLTIQFNSFTVAGSIDESNSGGYYTLPPEDPCGSAKRIWEFLLEHFSLGELGVVIADSKVSPMRNGVNSYAIGWWGIEPVIKHQGKTDLFGRELEASSTNVIDSLAAGASVVWGETDKATPLVVVRNIPDVVFTSSDTSEQLSHPLEQDVFYPLLQDL